MAGMFGMCGRGPREGENGCTEVGCMCGLLLEVLLVFRSDDSIVNCEERCDPYFIFKFLD